MFNKFYDRKLGFIKFFGELSAEQQTNYLLAEPVWAAAERAGLTTAAVHWCATAGAFEGYRVDDAIPFTPSASDEERLATAGDLFIEKRPHLMLVYTTGVSPASYKHGPASPEVRQRLRKLDEAIDALRDKVLASDLGKETDFVIVSDHGFTQGNTKELCLQHVRKAAGIEFEFIVWGAVGHVFLTDAADAEQARQLISALEGVEKVVN